MTDTKALRYAIATAGVKYKYVAKALGITPYSLQKKIDNRTEFKASEIATLVELLALPERKRTEIFFAAKSD